MEVSSSTSEKWVDASYVHESGLHLRMHDAGYMYGWSSDAWLKHWIDEGWEIVLEPDGVGAFAKIRMRTDSGKLTLVMKKWDSPLGTESQQADVT